MADRQVDYGNGHHVSGIGHQKGDDGPDGATTGVRIWVWGDPWGAE